MEIGNYTSLEQRQLLSQSQIQGLEILAMDNVELSEFMQNEYLENPIIEHQPGGEMPGSMEEFKTWYDKNRFSYKGEETSYHEEEHEGIEVAGSSGESIYDYLNGQINQWRYSPKEKQVIYFLMNCLDDNGYFQMNLEEIAAINHTDKKMVEECLMDLRQLEPFGIFAEDLEHCLLRQLEVLGIEDGVLEEIVRYHLKDLGEGKYSVISRALGLTTLQVRKYGVVIGSLNPRPLAGFQAGETSYVVPDIILSYEEGEWNISLNDTWIGDYKLSDYYMNLMSEAKDEELFQYFKGKLERARFLMQSIEQRRDTMQKISASILLVQEEFFLAKSELKPMSMSIIASQIGVHPSTVSRGVKGKYLQYPHGTLPIKNLFSGSVGGEGNQQEGSTPSAIKKKIKEYIEAEDKSKPYSDQKIAELLIGEQVEISRRAVAKYREELGIRGSFERKQVKM